MRLEDVHSPADIRGLSYEETADLAAQIRKVLIRTVSQRGGHLASNLGVVELTLALHRVFETPTDKLVFDVGHQSYVHKLITGRYSRFHSLRTFGGLSGFPKRGESEYDVFETGHASTAISAALGLARARDLRGESHSVIAVVGDGAMTGGMCYEALNDAGSSKTRLIVILNDNGMSIAPNVGALSRHLTRLRASAGWNSTKKAVKTGVQRIPLIGQPMYRIIDGTKRMLKSLMVDEGFFGALGFRYLGPVDGHNQKGLERILRQAKALSEPVLIHVQTVKGQGYDKAEEKPEIFHGTPPFYVETGDRRTLPTLSSYGTVMARELADMAAADSRIVAITAAMPSGTGLDHFAEAFPKRLIDTGIAEEHAATMAAGLAAGGMRPYLAVYATFFQRCYDQVIHDICMQHLPVVFLLDRAGLVGEDGATHHGVFDLAQLLPVPGITVLAPRDIGELKRMLRWSITSDGPVAIRYGKQSVDLSGEWPDRPFEPGHWEQLAPGRDCVLLAMGSIVPVAAQTRLLLREAGIDAGLVNCSTVKPLDENMLRQLAGSLPMFTLEEHLLNGGFGSEVSTWCVKEELKPPVMSFGIHESYVQHGRREQLLRYLGLAPEQLSDRIRVILSGKKTGGKGQA